MLAVGAYALAAPAEENATVTVQLDRPGAVIDRHLYGQFAEHLGSGIYEGLWVGEGSAIPNTRGYRNDVLQALRQLHVPDIRWPGGCFADAYDWREGVGPRAKRPVRVNTNWGGVEEPNTFGTHEFLDFTELVGADAYLTGNIGSLEPRQMADWVEYITSPTRSTLANQRRANGRDQPWKLPFFGVGNEVWGCGGNMRPEYASDLFRRYQTFVKVPAGEKLMKIASGPYRDDYHFTEVMMREAGELMDGLSLHYYTYPSGVWAHRGPSTGFGEDQFISTLAQGLRMEELLERHIAIMDRYDPAKKVALVVDEWGVWTDSDPGTNPDFLREQNTLREALVAAVTLNIFHAHADRVRMANLAQMVNVVDAILLTRGAQLIRTPTYHVFDMYQRFQGATSLPVAVQTPSYGFAGLTVPEVQASAARSSDGVTHLALVNLNPHQVVNVRVALRGAALRAVSGKVLTAPAIDSANTFERPDTVKPEAFQARLRGEVLSAALPPKSIVVLDLR